jgi:transcriptional regulator with GAF, ATPase, and Fis domain
LSEPISPLGATELLAALPDGVLAFDDERRIVFLNHAAERILRCPSHEALGSDVDRFGADEGVSGQRAAVEHLRSQPGTLLFFGEVDGIYARRADGTLFLHEGSIARMTVAGQSVTVVVFRDVDERRHSSDTLTDVRRQAEYLREEIQSLYNYGEILGRSPALARTLDRVEQVSATETTVLLLGESGTGKELVARAIHARSRRRDKPLIKVNCAALSPGLVESELFGHERGAFTGASARRVGRFELAHQGTLFLDEIGDVPPDIQVKLLRVLQEREFERVGGAQTLRVDVRLVAATNRDLEARVAEGKFREDLFYRLHVFPIRVPPLRERLEDVPLLATYFAQRFAQQLGKATPRIGAATLAQLAAYDWPGNVRELANVIERAVILARGAELELGPDVLPSSRAPASRAVTPAATEAGDALLPLEEVERRHIRATLDATGWRIGGPDGTAARLGLPDSTLRSRMKKLGITRRV